MKNSNLIVEVNPEKISRGFLEDSVARSLGKKGIVLEPLFDSTIHIEKRSRDQQQKQAKWNIQQTKEDENSWDAAHELMDRAKGSDIVYVEPDVLSKTAQHQAKKTRGAKTDFFDDYLPQWSYPKPDDFTWHLKKSKLDKVRHKDPGPTGPKVRIAHFDTGYDGGHNGQRHPSEPKYLNLKLGKNLVEGGLPNDRRVKGVLDNPGHGPATMALLAGNSVEIGDIYNDYMGAVPFAEIIPFRISSSVVLLKNSAFAEALQYAMDLKCDVVTMSMGGLASKLWAEKVNEAYEAGIVLVTAAGNNFGGHLPTHRVIYPSRFNRVITACGVTHNDTPYYNSDYGMKVMMGNWGPEAVMYKAVGAYTPNVPWARMMSEGGGFSRDGGGTSSATPQIAATAALYIEKHKNHDFAKPWHRVEAVRTAILESARNIKDLEQYIGNGILNAEAALKFPVPASFKKTPEDSVRFPLLNVLFGNNRSKNVRAALTRSEMFETELLQLIDLDPQIDQWEQETKYLDKVDRNTATKADHEELAALVRESAFASEALKKILR